MNIENKLLETLEQYGYSKEKIDYICDKYIKNTPEYPFPIIIQEYNMEKRKTYFVDGVTNEEMTDKIAEYKIDKEDAMLIGVFQEAPIKRFEDMIYDAETDLLLWAGYELSGLDKLINKRTLKIKYLYAINKNKYIIRISESAVELRLQNNKEISFERGAITRYNKKQTKLVQDYFGRCAFVQGNRPMELSEHNIVSFFSYKEVVKKSSKNQTLLDEITKENPEYVGYTPSKYLNYYKKYETAPAFMNAITEIVALPKADLQILNNGWLLLRGYYEIVTPDGNEILDAVRFYYKDNKVIKARRCLDGTFITAIGIDKNHSVFTMKTCNISPEVYEKTCLKYVKDVIENTAEDNKMNIIYEILNCPDIEQLYKVGFNKLIKKASESDNDFLRGITEFFGCRIETKGSIYAKYGINKYQADKIINYLEGDKNSNPLNYHIMSDLRDSLPTKILTDIDNKTFDRLFKIVVNANSRTIICMIIKKLSILRNFNFAIDRGEELMDMVLKNESQHVKLSLLYLDICSMAIMVRQLITPNMLKVIKPEDIKTLHDNLVYIVNSQQNEIYQKSFDEFQKKWNKYLYKDDNYSIISPKEADDLVKEGIELHHCVKSYIDSTCKGKTNILFLRKNNELDKPFFTIELTNDDKVRQIHGFANCGLEQYPEVKDFYSQWLQEKSLSTYSKNGAYAPE